MCGPGWFWVVTTPTSLARNGVTQRAISETQKFGRVTYFWNSNRSGAFDRELETYIEVPSDTLPFEERPWMKAAKITDRPIDELRSGRHRHAHVPATVLQLLGYAAPDDYEPSLLA